MLFKARTVNSNSNWTLIRLNLPYSKGSLRRNKTKTVNQISVSRDRKRPSTTKECHEVSKT